MRDLTNVVIDTASIHNLGKGVEFTPSHIVKDMIDLIESEHVGIFNPNTTFLDIAVVSGRFLIEIYNRLFNSISVIEAYPNEIDRQNHILHNQLFGLAKSPLAASLARMQLYNDATVVGNIEVLDKNISKKDIQRKFEIMQFDVVIGNPPYNNDMYLDFVTLGDQLAKQCTCMITPAKWQAKTDGKPKNSKNPTPDKNEEFRKNIVPYMSKIVVYKDTKDIFDIGEPGGISYFLIDKERHNTKYVKTMCKRNKLLESDEFEPHDETNVTLYNHKILSIIGKVGTLGEGFKQSLYVKNTDHGEITIDGTLGFKRQTFIGEQDRGEALKQAGYVEVMQGEKVVGYKAIKDLFTTVGLNKYKCIQSCMPVQGSSDPFGKDDGLTLGSNLVMILGPYQVPKGSFQVLRYFDTYSEALNFKKYLNSKTMSLMQFLGLCGATMTKEFFRFIPDPQDWTLIYEDAPLSGYTPDENGVYTDNDGNKHCSLYSKYRLDDGDIRIIESIIKERK